MEVSRLDRVQIDVAGKVVEISWNERKTLLFELRFVAGCETIIEIFKAVGAGRSLRTRRRRAVASARGAAGLGTRRRAGRWDCAPARRACAGGPGRSGRRWPPLEA